MFNTLGKVTGIRIQPFKGKARVTAPMQGLNIGDALGAASMFAPGGIAGIGNIGKWSLGNAGANLGLGVLDDVTGSRLNDWLPMLSGPLGMGALGALQSQGSAAAQNGLQGSGEQMFAGLTGAIMPTAMYEAQGLAELAPLRRTLLNNALSSLQQGGTQGDIDAFYSRAMGAASQQMQRQLSGLRNVSPSVAEGLRLSAMNQATEARNAYASMMNTPEQQAARAASQLELLTGANTMPVYSTAANMAAQMAGLSTNRALADAQLRANREPSVFERIIGTVPALLPYMDELFGVSEEG